MDIELKYAFPPSVAPNATKLILGSMPSVKSLEHQQYYAHPRNAFWRIMGDLFGFERSLPYEQRLQALRDHGIALWDSLSGCQRPGSLDANIRHEIPNNFNDFLVQYSKIRQIFFNGQTAFKFFKKYNRELCDGEIEIHLLPSTSPANAMLSYEGKLEKWSIIAQ